MKNQETETENILNLLENKKLKDVREIFSNLPEEDIAEILEELDNEYLAMAFRLIKKDIATEVFENLDPDKQLELLNFLSEERFSEIIEKMDIDERIELFEEAPAGVVNKLYSMLSSTQRKLTYRILGYPEDSIGRSINTKFLAIRKDATVKEALETVREKGRDLETVFYIYVLDSKRTLYGVISLKDLVIANDDDKIENITETNIVTANPYMDQEEVIDIFEKYDLIAIPVVDKEKKMLGIVTFDDLTDIIEEEKEEDFEVMAGITHTDETYMDASLWHLVKKRVIWLLIFLLIETLSGFVLQHYDDFLRQFIILSFFIPMLLNAGGTAGSQTATLIIRGIAIGEINSRDIFKIILKETVSAVLISIILSIVVIVRVLLIKTPGTDIVRIIAVVSLTLVFVVWFGSILAAISPLVVKKMGWDPAVMSGPLVTTAIDVIGLVIYFRIATWFL